MALGVRLSQVVTSTDKFDSLSYYLSIINTASLVLAVFQVHLNDRMIRLCTK